MSPASSSRALPRLLTVALGAGLGAVGGLLARRAAQRSGRPGGREPSVWARATAVTPEPAALPIGSGPGAARELPAGGPRVTELPPATAARADGELVVEDGRPPSS